MDPISHLTIGTAVAAMAPPEVRPAVMLITAVAAASPDVDFVVRLARGDGAYLREHRGVTHGPTGLLALAAALALVNTLLHPTLPFATSMLWALLGCISHTAFDVTNAYGTQALSPFTRRRYQWDLTPIVDVWSLGLIAVGWLLVGVLHLAGRGGPRLVPDVFAGVWVAQVTYIGLRWRLHRRALAQVSGHFAAQGYRHISCTPAFLDPWRWRYVVHLSGGDFATGIVHTARGVWGDPEIRPTAVGAVVDASLQSLTAQTLVDFARYPRPHWAVRGDGNYVVTWTDVRYEMGDYCPFTAEVILDPDLKLIDERLGGPGITPENRRRIMHEEFGRLH